MRSLPKNQVVTTSSSKTFIGKNQKHESADKHVSGEALYVDDQPSNANTLHAYIGLSTVARGIITKLDLSKVKAAKGVVDILILKDVPGHTDIGPIFPGDPLMVNEGDEVQFYGQVLFAVAATSHDLARKAAKLSIVEYQQKTADITIEQGLANESFVRPSHTIQCGDTKQALARAHHTLSGEMQIGGQEQMYLEGQASYCVPTEDGGMTVYTSTQNPSEGQKLVAEVLNVPLSKVTVDMRRMGGGFGGKETNANQWACIAALLANKTNRAVKIKLARADDMVATGKRHHFLSQYKVGFDECGLIQALDITLSGGCGISPDLSDAIVDRAMFHCDNAYHLANANITGHRVKTNTVSNTAFRGFGGPQGMVAIENIIDNVARVVGKDPLEIRKLNFYGAKGNRDVTPYGQKIEQHIIPDLVTRLEKTSNYQQRRQAIAEFNKASPILKKGLSLTPVKFGISFTAQHLNQAGALVHVYTDGSIALNHGGTEMGQGLFTKIAQIVAYEFSVDIDTVNCMSTRTDKVPNTSPTAASSGTDLNGMAARDAVLKIKQRMINFACEHFNLNATEISFNNNQVIAAQQTFSFAEFAQLAYMNRVSLSATGYYKTPKIYYDREKGQGHPFFYYANGAAVSEVLIDTLTGENKVLRVDICQDVGQSLNPAIDIGQVEGAFIQGMGWMTTVELVWGDDGRLQTMNPAGYKIPAIGDTPTEFNVELMPDSPNIEATIFHSKAVGEPPLMLGISVWCAIRDALSSISDYQYSPSLDTPATPERILAACEQMSNLAAKQA
ncbi:MAG: xanthine dehydrogenase molybdopterin binding subunit [Colwellia sp.]|nr:xanthine dehydrogenase molybdopterin binding subunit [Colwellia sp.]